jgi:hypothetical protein
MNTNMAAVTSRANALLVLYNLLNQILLNISRTKQA